MSTNYKFDYTIIGGGPIGLITALLLNKHYKSLKDEEQGKKGTYFGIDFNKKICVVEKRASYTREQILFVNKKSLGEVIEPISNTLFNKIVVNSCFANKPPFLKTPLCFSDINIQTYESEQKEGEVDIILTITTNKLESILNEYIINNMNAAPRDNTNLITLIKPTKDKLESLFEDYKLTISGESNLFLDEDSFPAFTALANNVIIDSKVFIGADGPNSITRPIICGAEKSDTCMKTFNESPPNYGMYIIIDLGEKIINNMDDTNNDLIKDDKGYYLRSNPQNSYRVFINKDGKMYIGLRITEEIFNNIKTNKSPEKSKENNKNMLDKNMLDKNEQINYTIVNLVEYFLRMNLFYKYKKLVDDNYIYGEERIVLQNFITIINNKINNIVDVDKINKLTNFKKNIIIELNKIDATFVTDTGYDIDGFVKKNIYDYSVFEATPKYTENVASRVNDKLFFIIGDSAINVHFFSGTGVNSGIEYANKLVEIIGNSEIIKYGYNYYDILNPDMDKISTQPNNKDIIDDINSKLDLISFNYNKYHKGKYKDTLKTSVDIINSTGNDNIIHNGEKFVPSYGGNIDDYYKHKYLKYKSKYISLRNM